MKKLLLLLLTASPLAACTYVLDSTGFLFQGTAAQQSLSGSVKVTVTPDTATTTCTAWTATTSSTWIHLDSSTVTGTTSGTIKFTLDANNSSTMRQDTITFMDKLTITIYQLAATCTYSVSPATASIGVSGGSGTLQVTSGCTWSPSISDTWLTVTQDQSNLFTGAGANFGGGKLNYAITANSCVTSRTATVTISTGSPNPPTFTATQDGSTSNLALSGSSASVGASSSTGVIYLTTGNGCSWTAYSDASWLKLSATSGSGSGALGYTVSANTGPARSGAIHVGTQTFTITQAAVAATSVTLAAVTNAASAASGAISPGEIISLWGTNMGPTAGVAFQPTSTSQSFPTTLGGVQVFIGGTAAPLTYVSATQINAVVPYGISGSSSTAAYVQYSSQSSNSLTLTVQSATPGIFSQDRSGTGPGAILNQDSSLNESLAPATRGSVIQIFCTGGGVTSPTVSDGAPSPSAEPLARLVTTPVAVTIGGISATVNYAGGAPTLVAGMVQINAAVPQGVTTGNSVPVIVTIGSWTSQTVTITVK